MKSQIEDELRELFETAPRDSTWIPVPDPTSGACPEAGPPSAGHRRRGGRDEHRDGRRPPVAVPWPHAGSLRRFNQGDAVAEARRLRRSRRGR